METLTQYAEKKLDGEHKRGLSEEDHRKMRVHTQIRTIRRVQEINRKLRNNLAEAQEKLAIHEHYMNITGLLTRPRIDHLAAIGRGEEEYLEKELECLVHDLRDSVAEKCPGNDPSGVSAAGTDIH